MSFKKTPFSALRHSGAFATLIILVWQHQEFVDFQIENIKAMSLEISGIPHRTSIATCLQAQRGLALQEHRQHLIQGLVVLIVLFRKLFHY